MSIQYQIIEQKEPHGMVLHGEEVNNSDSRVFANCDKSKVFPQTDL